MNQESLLGGRYRLGRALGRGGMGTVWHARDVMLDREVAVKRLFSPEDDADAQNQRAAHLEWMSRLPAHPGIVTVHDVIEESGQIWIVSDLVRGRSMQQLLAERGPLPAPWVTELARQLLDALRHAHGAGLTHRDIKPGNVMVSDAGRAKLIDFGTAYIEHGTQPTAQSVQYTGSPAFRPPEAERGEWAGPASDLWSLGATLYAAVEGRTPYGRPIAGALLTGPVPPRDTGPLARVLEALLRPDPERRPSAAQALSMLAEGVSAADPAPPLPVPRAVTSPLTAEDTTELGPYTIVGRLGEGGTGVVYKARDGGGRDVAVHLFRNARLRLVAESVRHPALVPILDTGEFEGRPYVVTEFVDGLSLEGYVELRGPLSGGLLDRLALETVTGLAVLHGAEVIHRNLKPSNVIMGRAGAQLVDAGVAPVDENPELLFGTPGYMAPELLDGSAPTPAVDVFAWAVTIVFAATGRRLFDGTDTMEIIQSTLFSEPDLSGVPEGRLRDLLVSCLAKDRSRRPSAVNLSTALLDWNRPRPDAPALAPTGAQPMSPRPMPLPTKPRPVPVPWGPPRYPVPARRPRAWGRALAVPVVAPVAVVRLVGRWLRARRAPAPPVDGVLRARALIARGRYAEAQAVLTEVIRTRLPPVPAEVYG
ncbi:MAG: protein kinase domain-containing protein, partial [Spirillospora sp.]